MDPPIRKSVYGATQAVTLTCPGDRYYSRIRVFALIATSAVAGTRYTSFGHFAAGAQGALAPLGLQAYTTGVAPSKTGIMQLGRDYQDFDATEIGDTLVCNRHFDGVLRPGESMAINRGAVDAGDTYRTFIEYFDEPYNPIIHG